MSWFAREFVDGFINLGDVPHWSCTLCLFSQAIQISSPVSLYRALDLVELIVDLIQLANSLGLIDLMWYDWIRDKWEITPSNPSLLEGLLPWGAQTNPCPVIPPNARSPELQIYQQVLNVAKIFFPFKRLMSKKLILSNFSCFVWSSCWDQLFFNKFGKAWRHKLCRKQLLLCQLNKRTRN